MKNYKPEAYLIKNKTNLHVGSGESSFGIVDNMVQRDTVSNMPVIFSSSLKGAIRDHFRDYFGDKHLEIDGEKVCATCFESIFGAEGTNEQSNESNDTKPSSKKVHHQGLVKFLDARLVFLPLRSNKVPFIHAVSKEYLKEVLEFLKDMGIDLDIDIKNLTDNKVFSEKKLGKVMVEDIEFDTQAPDETVKKLMDIFDLENLAVMKNEDFNYYISNLPVIARNQLDNGKSKNLWYEEVVPRESRFVTVFMYYDNFDESDKDKFEKAFRKFKEKLTHDNIQIGANESIGYGICKFEELKSRRK